MQLHCDTDMVNPPPEARMFAVEDKIERQDEKLGKIIDSAENMSGDLREIKTKLELYAGAGKWIAGLFALIFSVTTRWLVYAHLPDKLNDAVPPNFKERFGALEQNVNNLTTQMGRLVPNSLNQILAPGKVPSAQDLQRASHLVDTALQLQLPGNKAQLIRLSSRVDGVVGSSKPNTPTRSSAQSLAVRLRAYESASDGFAKGSKPITEVKPDYNVRDDSSFFIGFTMTCTKGPIAHFLGFSPNNASTIVIFDVHVEGCSQRLGGPKWISTEFDRATIEYDGGPLNLAGVVFRDCNFKFGNDPQSRAVLAEIISAKNKPVDLWIQ